MSVLLKKQSIFVSEWFFKMFQSVDHTYHVIYLSSQSQTSIGCLHDAIYGMIFVMEILKCITWFHHERISLLQWLFSNELKLVFYIFLAPKQQPCWWPITDEYSWFKNIFKFFQCLNFSVIYYFVPNCFFG